MADILRDCYELISSNKETIKKEGKHGRKSEIMDRVNQLKNTIENKLKETVDRFKNAPLTTYISSPTPNEIYAKFITAKYENEWKEIEDIIIKEVRAQLETACRDVETESLIQTQHFIRQCKTVMAVLPDHMKEMLNTDIKQSEAEIKDKINKAMRNADEVLNTKNVDHINYFLDTCTNLEKNEIERQAPIIIRNMVERINQKWANEDVTGVLKDLKDLLNIKSTKLNLSAANNSFESTRNTFTDQFGNLGVLDRYEVSPKTIESIEQLLDFFIQCMDFKADMKNKANEVMPSDFNEKVKELDRKISNSFSSLEKKCNINIVQKNAQDLQKVLDIIKIQKLKTFKQKKMDCGIPEDFSTSSNLWTYSEIMNTLNSHLEKMLNDMIMEGIINETTTKANDMELNQYFQNMKDTLDFMQQMSQCKTTLQILRNLNSV
ncbi:viral A-type inclusion protein [Reticulomyxa filosa]|uniref:Viral A-type inclusion protein n=1 Tax=Reticulomyxa filosa TaxID=46433 RepID=X6M382_RETFI|nr:viral A-type inclusion protein [Reticulomyxa filosa]|eukprot:ETO08111.1 viral A-type inclusion protein [Reticulomyxa filosa]